MPIDAPANPPFSPGYLVAPGDTLAEMLEERALSQTELARRLGVSLKHINQVVNGAVPISADLALALEKVLGVTASFWLKRDALYQAEIARREEQRDLADEVEWAERFPISELKKRGHIDPKAKGAELVASLLRFLGLASPRQWSEPIVSYRRSLKLESNPYALATWLRVGELEARSQQCDPYDADRFTAALQEIRGLTRLGPQQWQPELYRLCREAGVAVVIVDTFKGAAVHGAARWLAPHRALIQLSLRYRWEDIFWFSFFHEAGHILLHRKKELFVEPKKRPTGTSPDVEEWLRIEHQADRFASRTLIPRPYDKQLASLTLGEVPAFADRVGVTPAAVIGRMQHDGRLPFNAGNHLRRRLAFAE